MATEKAQYLSVSSRQLEFLQRAGFRETAKFTEPQWEMLHEWTTTGLQLAQAFHNEQFERDERIAMLSRTTERLSKISEGLIKQTIELMGEEEKHGQDLD